LIDSEPFLKWRRSKESLKTRRVNFLVFFFRLLFYGFFRDWIESESGCGASRETGSVYLWECLTGVTNGLEDDGLADKLQFSMAGLKLLIIYKGNCKVLKPIKIIWRREHF